MQVFFALMLFLRLSRKFKILVSLKFFLQKMFLYFKKTYNSLASEAGKCYTTFQLKRMKL